MMFFVCILQRHQAVLMHDHRWKLRRRAYRCNCSCQMVLQSVNRRFVAGLMVGSGALVSVAYYTVGLTAREEEMKLHVRGTEIQCR